MNLILNGISMTENLDSDGVPLEMFHAKQQLKDFRHYYQFFRGVKDWTPDE